MSSKKSKGKKSKRKEKRDRTSKGKKKAKKEAEEPIPAEPEPVKEPEPEPKPQPAKTTGKKVYQKVVVLKDEAVPKIEKKLNKYGVDWNQMPVDGGTKITVNIDANAPETLKAKVADAFWYLDSSLIVENNRAKTVQL